MNPDFYKTSTNFKDYINGNDSLRPFYAEALSPDWKKLCENVHQNFKRQDVVLELRNQNKKSNDSSIQKNVDLLKKEKTLIVVTGQQMGLMVSPLYVVYKTLSTIKLAEKLNKEVDGFNFVPVYWLEGEDHDFEEVNHLNYFDSAGLLQKLHLEENEAEKGLPMNKRLLGQDIEELLKSLKENLQKTDFSDEFFVNLEKIYKKGENWLEAFSNHLSIIFSGKGLLLFNAGTKRIKELSKPFFEKVIIENESLVSAFSRRSNDLSKAGYKNQVNIQNDRAYLFLNHNDGPRLSLLRQNKSFYVRELDEQFSLEQMLTMLDENPSWFSSTVLTRPLWQSWLLPAVSYVAGAAEIAYWGQLKSGFNQLGLIMPQIQPRHSITLIEPKIDRLIKKYNVTINSISRDKTIFLKDYFNRNQLANVNKAFSDYEQLTIKNREAVKNLVAEIDPTLSGPTEKSFGAILSTIEKLQNRLVNRVREKDETTQKHLGAIFNSLMPSGVLQERILSSVYLENKYGQEWINTVYNEIDENFQHHLVVKI
ncbi:MAG: bacillithiol biosynthesis cysteine-adding enzyme BshC [Calditrichaeota bacterium]|nr:MAG: bacillithiol biosynthesis cysteine-adding enzyme BshC [Calditrichota bacterium]MBL1206753.1 bacillithiol biosynthesis cysteine-adding enzyme BshC [Calditrichota bacterium]NOG46579.1 bacillithiol biosynthesis cysteine-adding enzyme BshC [Calditrichota bacterium]